MAASKPHVTKNWMSWKVYLASLFMVGASIGAASAQRNKGNAQQVLDWAKGVIVDGSLAEWGDSLRYEHALQQFHYEIRNDRENVYVAMRVVDKDRQMQIFAQGLAFMLNTAGKRREGPTVYFPVADRLAFRSIMSADNDDRPDDMRKGALQAIRAIYVMRFEDVLDGQISLDNHYGIQARAMLDTADALCVEMAVPLKRLGVAVDHNEKLAFNIKINGVMVKGSGTSPTVMRTGYPYGYYGYPYAYGQPAPARPREEPGVWVLAPLADD